MKFREAPAGIRVAVWLVVAYALIGLVTTLISFIAHGVSGASIFTGASSHVPPPPTMANLLSAFVIVELIWLGVPVVLAFAAARGSNVSRVVISIIAALGLLVSVRWFASPLLFLPQVLFVLAAALLWIPSSTRHIQLQKRQSRQRKKEMDALDWHPKL